MEMSERVEIRLSGEELQRIEERMKETGITNRSSYIRKMALNGYVLRLDLSGVQEIIRLLRINSNNLNQYAKKANETGCVYEEDIRNLKVQQAELWQEMRNLLVALGKM